MTTNVESITGNHPTASKNNEKQPRGADTGRGKESSNRTFWLSKINSSEWFMACSMMAECHDLFCGCVAGLPYFE